MKQINKNPFYVSGMKVSEILNLGDEILSKFSSRDMSRALRTVALAANKRIKRLTQYLKRRGGRWVEKVNSPGLDTRAINQLGNKKFGVGNKSRNEMYEEFARVRKFMKDKGSTVTGAVEIRKNHERALFGQTREEITKGMSPKEKKEKIEEIKELSNDVYEAYDEFKDEYAMQGGYDKEKGQVILQDIGRDMLEGIPKDAAKANANLADTQRYESGQETTADFWQSVNGESEWWEDI